jgi:hypothetical protein
MEKVIDIFCWCVIILSVIYLGGLGIWHWVN